MGQARRSEESAALTYGHELPETVYRAIVDARSSPVHALQAQVQAMVADQARLTKTLPFHRLLVIVGIAILCWLPLIGAATLIV